MKDKKIRWQWMFFLFVFSMFCSSFSLHTAKADEPKIADNEVTIDYEKQEATVIMGSNQVIYYGKGTQDKAPKDWEETNVSNIATISINNSNQKVAIIDLSFLAPGKDEYLYLKGDYATGEIYVLVKKQLKLKCTFIGLLDSTTDSTGAFKTAYDVTQNSNKVYSNFSKETGYFTFFADGAAYTDLSKIEWRKGLSGTWKPLTQLNLLKFKANGAVLYFRINNGIQQISNECKITYPKLANAPNVNIDGAKHTIKLTDKMEYRVKVSTGSYLDWTTPTFENNKTSGTLDLTALTGADAQGNGNGISTALKQMTIQVRMKATSKKTGSKIRTITLYQSETPAFGSNGIEVGLVKTSDIKKGIKITNHTNIAYQVAILDKKDQGAYKVVTAIDLTAKSKEPGAISFVNVQAGKSVVISYNKFKDFQDNYVVVCRTAMVKENTKTAATEFRLASAIVPVGGDTPISDTESGVVMMGKNDTQAEKNVTFTVENPDSVIYTSLNGADFSINTTGKVNVKASKGNKVVIKAYSKNKNTGELSSTVTVTLNFVADGELADYVNEWGYALCKKEDTEKSSNSRQIAYQRIYLGYLSFNGVISAEDLNLSVTEFGNIAQRVRVDNPELLQATGSLSYTTSGSYIGNVTLGMTEKSKAEAMKTECEKCLDEVKKQIKDTYGDTPTKLQQVKVIHDYLVLKKEYKSSSMDQTIAGALCNDYTPVCMAYSMAFKYFCDEVGVQTYVVLGYTGGSIKNRHAWNNVNMGDTITYATASSIDAGKWYEMDVTWDDPLNMAADYVGYTYFNITTQAMETASHTRLYEYYTKYPVDKCTGNTFTYAAISAQSNYANGNDIKETMKTDSIQDLIERSGEKKPVYTQK